MHPHALTVHAHAPRSQSLLPPRQPRATPQLLSRDGFATTPRERRGRGWVSETALNHKRQQKLDRLHKTTHDLAVAWGLSLFCGLGHLAHVWSGAPGWMHALHHPVLAATLSAAALLGELLGHTRTTAPAAAAAAGAS